MKITKQLYISRSSNANPEPSSTGEYEDAKAVNDLLIKKNIDTVIHIDAASGGFVAPFVVPDLEWDFRLEKVVSINTSGHKYGFSVFPVSISLTRA